MSKKYFFSFSIIAVAFAMAFVFGSVSTAKAVPTLTDEFYQLEPGQAFLTGADFADNSVANDRDRDIRADEFQPEQYGLFSQAQQ